MVLLVLWHQPDRVDHFVQIGQEDLLHLCYQLVQMVLYFLQVPVGPCPQLDLVVRVDLEHHVDLVGQKDPSVL